MSRPNGALSVVRLLAPLFLALPLSAGVLFEKPLHLTREVDDPLTGRTRTAEEYYLGNRVVTVTGDWTVIADYDKAELTEIDRAHGTYSVTPFATVASSRPHRTAKRTQGGAAGARAEVRATAHRSGSARRAGRAVDVFTSDDPGLHAEVAVDSSATLSRDAFDVIVGAAHPNEGSVAADVARAAARRSPAQGASQSESYGLPLEQTLRFDAAGQTLVSSNRVTRVGDELAPGDLLAIPPGAQRVDSHLVRTAREGEQLDVLPSKARP